MSRGKPRVKVVRLPTFGRSIWTTLLGFARYSRRVAYPYSSPYRYIYIRVYHLRLALVTTPLVYPHHSWKRKCMGIHSCCMHVTTIIHTYGLYVIRLEVCQCVRETLLPFHERSYCNFGNCTVHSLHHMILWPSITTATLYRISVDRQPSD